MVGFGRVRRALFAVAAWGVVWQGVCEAHDGRRFIIEVVAGQLRAQGVNSGPSDGAPAVREYANAIHDHWLNIMPTPGSGLEPFASSFLPDFEAPLDVSFSLIRDHTLSLEWTRALQWSDPPAMPADGTVPRLTPLSPGEVIQIESTQGVVDSVSLGALVLSPSVPAGGIEDIVMNYQINGQPADTVHVLEFILSATPNAPGAIDQIADSDPIYVILSPDGSDKLAREHYASLYLEEYLATNPITVPEPNALAIVAGVVAITRGRRRAA